MVFKEFISNRNEQNKGNTVMYEFWYGFIKPKYQEKANICYMDADSFIVNMKTVNVYKDIANDFEKLF